VICKINGEVKGEGRASRQAVAKNEAARQTLEALGVAVDR